MCRFKGIVNGVQSNCWPGSSVIPQSSALKPILVNVFISERIQCNFSSFEDDSKLGSTVNLPEGTNGSAEVSE